MSDFVTAVNSNGNKQVVPARWLDHPVFGDDFRLPPSEKAKRAKAEKPAEKPAEPDTEA